MIRTIHILAQKRAARVSHRLADAAAHNPVQVEEQKRRAEADKLAAITALEQRSREFMREKEAKARLEARIASMQSQLLVGGAALEETPVFRCAALFELDSFDRLGG